MRCENHITIPGHLEDVLAVATPVERWALLLPDYRWVRFHGPSAEGTVLQFTARRGPLPLRWTAEQVVVPDEGRIIYRHLRGLTNGLCSEWRLVQAGPAVEVTVSHSWRPELPVIGEPLARLLCALLVLPITAATLAGLAEQVRTGHAAALRRLHEAYDAPQEVGERASGRVGKPPSS